MFTSKNKSWTSYIYIFLYTETFHYRENTRYQFVGKDLKSLDSLIYKRFNHFSVT